MGKTLLLVEDQLIIALSEKMMLEEFGYAVVVANTGESAIECMQTNPAIDLILMDIDLGSGIDGTAAAKVILSNHDIPLIFLSAHTEREVVEKTEGITSYGYVIKNSGETVLNAAIKMAFKLFTANRKFKHGFEASPIPYALNDIHQNITDLNFAFTRTFGYDLSDIPTLSDWWPLAYPDVQYRQWVADEWQKRLDAVAQTGQPFERMEVSIRCKDGSLKIVLASATFLESTGLNQVILYDITEQKISRNRLDESIKFNESLIGSMYYGFSIIDASGFQTQVNEAFCKMTGFTSEELTGAQAPFPYWPPEEYENINAAFQKALKEEATQFDLVFMRKNGERFNAIVSPAAIKNAQGEILNYAATIIDITERKLFEKKTKALIEEKELILKEAHHRMKNHFASIENLLVLQIKEYTDIGITHALQDAVSRVKSMRVLYDKLLLTNDPNEISAKAYIESLCDAVVAIFPNHVKIVLEKQVGDFKIMPNRLFTIGIILNELLTNSLKYAFVNKEAGTIKILVTHIDKHLTLSIHDNGNGLPSGFDINKSKGFGIQIVRMLSQQLMAKLTVENDGGAKFTMEFDI
jgi:PAS domain S-box-containing protein